MCSSIKNEIIGIMGGFLPPSPPDRAALQDLEQRVTHAMVESMALLKQARIHYPDELIEHLSSQKKTLQDVGLIEGCPIAALPTELFEISVSGDKIALKEGVLPSKALRSILDPSSGPISIDCLVAIQICSNYALMQTLGDEKFDVLCSTHPHYNLQFTNEDPRGAPRYLRKQTDLLLMPSEIKRGDIVRFDGVPRYLERHPNGYWQGLNTICTKEGRDPLFDAHGLERPMIEEEICKLLTDAMKEPKTQHKAKGRALRSLRWDLLKLFHIKQTLEKDLP